MNTELGVRREAVQLGMTDSVDYENSGGTGGFVSMDIRMPFPGTCIVTKDPPTIVSLSTHNTS